MKPSESPEEAAMRALQEKIGVTTIDDLYTMGHEERTFIPDTLPGLESTYSMYKFTCTIPEEVYIAEGYKEEQLDKTNYYT